MARVSIAVLTYLRNEHVAELLPQLQDQVARLRCARPDHEVDIIVVDNDPMGGAAPTVRRVGGPSHVRYAHEPLPGIAAARNRALDESPPDGVLIFIDDDERPSEHWLGLMLDTWERHQPAAVSGPVVARFDGDIDPWVSAGGFFDRAFRSDFVTGQAVASAATGNLLLDMTRVRARGLRFDASLGLAGGEDTLFTRQLVASGEEIIWCGEAEVSDPVPPDRLTRRWLVRRVFMVANASALAAIRSAKGPRRALLIARYLVTGVVRIATGAARCIVGTLTGSQREQARGAGTVARGAGAVTAAAGVRFLEYGR